MIAELLQLGRLPEDADLLLRDEPIEFLVESVFASVTFRDFSRGGVGYSAWRRQRFFGSLAISDNRIVAYRGRSRQIDVPFDDPHFSSLRFNETDADILGIDFSANLFRRSWSGVIQFRYPVPNAPSALRLLHRHQQNAKHGSQRRASEYGTDVFKCGKFNRRAC
jgi:hypothetical protein